MAASPAQAQPCPGYRVVQSAAASFNQAASSGSLRTFVAVLERHADVSRVAMFALGPYRRALPAARRGEYVQLTRRFLGRVLAENAARFAGAKVVLLNCTSDRGFTLVDTRVGAHPIVWRLAGNRIVDMKVGGIWLSLQLRSNFVSVIQRGNGNPAFLIDYLRSGRSFGSMDAPFLNTRRGESHATSQSVLALMQVKADMSSITEYAGRVQTPMREGAP